MIKFLIPPWVVVFLVCSILTLKVIHFYKYRNWFILGLGAPLLFTLWIYAEEQRTIGYIDQPTARFSLVMILTVLFLNRLFDLILPIFTKGGQK